MKNKQCRITRHSSSRPLHLLLFPKGKSGSFSLDNIVGFLQNPAVAGGFVALVAGFIISTTSGASLLPASVVALPMGIAAACGTYLARLQPEFLRRTIPTGKEISPFQRLNFFSICFILGLAFFGQGILGAQFVEQIFGNVKFFTGFLIISVGAACLLLGQLTAVHFYLGNVNVVDAEFNDERQDEEIIDLAAEEIPVQREAVG